MTLAIPIMIAQISQTAMGFVDTVMAGRVSAQDLAAVALGGSIWLPVFLAFGGILMATTPIVAHLIGANQQQTSRLTLHQGSCIAAILGLLAFTFLSNCGWILEAMSVESELAGKTTAYLQAVAFGLPAVLGYQLIRSFAEGYGKTSPAMKISILGLLCNIPLNYIFIYGKFGLPAMGGVGCGWATAIVMWIQLFAGLLFLRKSPLFIPLRLFSSFSSPKLADTSQFLKLGVPIGISLLIESSMFSVIALLLAPLGETSIAAHQITLSFSGITFMVPLSIALALTIRVGTHLGAGDHLSAKWAQKAGILTTLFFAVLSSAAMLLAGKQIAALYTPEPQLILIAAELLAIAALFQFSDAIQVSAAGALRGYKDTAIPLLLVFVAYWVIGLPLGYVLGLTDIFGSPMGPHGFWYGLVTGLSFGALFLLARMNWMSNRATR